MSRMTNKILITILLVILILSTVVYLSSNNTNTKNEKDESIHLHLRKSEEAGNILATRTIDTYLQQCSTIDDSPIIAPYSFVEERTRDSTGHGWTKEMYDNLLLKRWDKKDAGNIMYSTTVTHLVMKGEPIQITNGILHTNVTDDDSIPIEVLESIRKWHTNNSLKPLNKRITTTNVKGLLVDLDRENVFVSPVSAGGGGCGGTNGGGESSCGKSSSSSKINNHNIFDVSKYVSAQIKGDSNDTQLPPRSMDSSKLFQWINLNVPTLSSDNDILFYGFQKIKSNHTFIVNSPVGYYPIIPVFIGNTYQQHIRGGLYIEHHNPIHIWSPTTTTVQNTKYSRDRTSDDGFILTAVPVTPIKEALWSNGWRGTDPLVPPSSGKYKLAKIKINVDETLVSHPFAYHCDGTLSGNRIYLTSFGFAPGPNGANSNDAAASGFQPIVSALGNA
jgi:hypothetical protein